MSRARKFLKLLEFETTVDTGLSSKEAFTQANKKKKEAGNEDDYRGFKYDPKTGKAIFT